jgi:DtxR family Mn-dependent transcriptional regulator
MYSFTEENYLKAIYRLQEQGNAAISTNAIAEFLQTRPASVTDMIKKLSDKRLLKYEKYKGVLLTETGKKVAIDTVRKHRLWETFLYNKLNFSWDKVHDIAEQLEHIQSEDLTDKLEAFLGFPQHDPHGDPIPAKNGKFKALPLDLLIDAAENKPVVVSGVADHSTNFLKHLQTLNITLGSSITVIKKNAYDQSVEIKIGKKKQATISFKVAKNLLVK